MMGNNNSCGTIGRRPESGVNMKNTKVLPRKITTNNGRSVTFGRGSICVNNGQVVIDDNGITVDGVANVDNSNVSIGGDGVTFDGTFSDTPITVCGGRVTFGNDVQMYSSGTKSGTRDNISGYTV